MPIRPIDMQVAVPRLQEVSRMNHLEQQKSELQQQQNSRATGNEVERELKTVVASQKDARPESEADARKEGRNKYVRQEQKKKKASAKNAPVNITNEPKSIHKIDIRI